MILKDIMTNIQDKIHSRKKKIILITGTAGFIGFHVARYFLLHKWTVIGIDGLTDYYDVNLKKDRHTILSKYKNFIKYEFLLQEFDLLKDIFDKYKPQYIIHLAAQAGVRYSFEKSREYLDANIIGTFNILEIVKKLNVKHLMISSTSSVYGNNDKHPYEESLRTDEPLSIYAATKKSCEILSHSYSHLFDIPTTILRFFTVYGPWGRPDMAPFKFTKKILGNEEIEVFNHGRLDRDFTYIDDIVCGVFN